MRRPKVTKVDTNVIYHNPGEAGVLPRIFPGNVNNIFTMLPMGNIGASGIAPRIAARPNSAPMLDSSSLYSNIPAVGLNLGIPSRGFQRGTPIVHPSAVSDVEHVRQSGVHPTIRRKVRVGDKAL